MKIFLKIALCALLTIPGFGQSRYEKDFAEFWTDIRDNYAYLEQQQINWDKVCEIYGPDAAKIETETEFIAFLEKVLIELHNGHSSLNANLASSNRIVPSGSDIRIEKQGDRFFVKDLRKGFGSDLAGLKIGMEVMHFNGKPIDAQLEKFLPKYTASHNGKMIQHALDMLFAGTHDVQREITAMENGKPKVFRPISYGNRSELLYVKALNSTTAYVKINNSLGNYGLIPEFDKTLDSLSAYKNFVLDLTETPSGGNSTVARAIMGRFVAEPMAFQVHEFDEKQYDTKRHWVEYALPRQKTYAGNLYILVGRWTGSMGEGIAIGFDGMKRGTVIGTPMAGLLGAISGFGMSETTIGFQIPTERLYHVNGAPREEFAPKISTKNIEETLEKAREIK